MFDAVNKWRGESPNTAKIERISAEARAEAKAEAKRQKMASMASVAPVWRDPFSDDPDKPIPVRLNGSKQKELLNAKREIARARAEAASAQADAAKARADAAKANASAARSEAVAALAQAVAAKHEAMAARTACGVGGGDAERRAPAPRLSSSSSATSDEPDTAFDSFAPPKRPRASHASRTGVVSNASYRRSPRVRDGAQADASPSSSDDKAGAAPAETTPPAPPPLTPPPPVAFANSGTGIIVVPITR